MSDTHPKNSHILMLGDKVRQYASIGGYPLFYVTGYSNVLCAKCVEDNLSQCVDPCDADLHIVAHEVNWEDSTLYCGLCDQFIESAY